MKSLCKTLVCIYSCILLLTLLAICTITTSCHGYTIHPGAPTKQASQIYDGLKVAQGVITEARREINSGDIPSTAINQFNMLVEAYNLTKAGLQTYVDVTKTPQDPAPFLQTLNNDMALLISRLQPIQQQLKRRP